jgi:hypothetical protein
MNQLNALSNRVEYYAFDGTRRAIRSSVYLALRQRTPIHIIA